MSKINKIKSHLLSGKPITGLEAIDKYGYYRLSDGILKLRKQGLDIITIMVDGKGTRYAKYALKILAR